MEAISVPRPPRFVPTMSSGYLSVKPDRSSAAGTLLMIWLERTATMRSCPVRSKQRAEMLDASHIADKDKKADKGAKEAVVNLF